MIEDANAGAHSCRESLVPGSARQSWREAQQRQPGDDRFWRMGINQYVYFALKSDHLSADQIAEHVGLEPDERVVRGSRTPTPPVPATHSWKLVCRKAGMRIDEQIENVLARVEPVRDNIRTLTSEGEVCAVLQVVRYFQDEDAAPAPLVELWGESGIEFGPEPNHLLGFHLSVDRLRLLADINASIDCDEYS